MLHYKNHLTIYTMEIRINKGLSIILIIALIAINYFIVPLSFGFMEFYPPNIKYDFSVNKLLMANLIFIISNLSILIIGIWLFFNVSKLNQDKWTWFLVGLVYGQYSLIFFGLILIIKNINLQIDLLKSFQIILILLVITFCLKFVCKQLFYKYLSIAGFGISNSFNFNYLSLGIMFLMNIVFAVKLSQEISNVKMTQKVIWLILTLVMGLFPVIMYNELQLIEKMKNNAA